MKIIIPIAALCFLSCTTFTRDNPFDPHGESKDNLAPVSGLRTISASFDHIDILWDAYTGAGGYTIERRLAVDGPVQHSQEQPTPGFVDHDVLPSTSYFYTVIAHLGNGMDTPPSISHHVATTDPPPIHIIYPSDGAELRAGQSAEIVWKIYDQGIQAVVVELSIDGGTTFTLLHTNPIDRITLSMNWTPLLQHVSNNCIISVHPPALPDAGAKSPRFAILE